MGQWLFSLHTDKPATTMQIAERVHTLAKEQNDPAIMLGAYRALAVTRYYLGDFEPARQYAMVGVKLWRSGAVQSPIEQSIRPQSFVGAMRHYASGTLERPPHAKPLWREPSPWQTS